MSDKNLAKFKIYSFIRKLVSFAPVQKLASSCIMQPARDLLFRPRGENALFGDIVKFENMDFYFKATYPTVYKAKISGIEARITRLAISCLQNGSTAFDVGANYGFITLAMGKSVYHDGKVYSFEADEKIFRVLQSSITKNGLSENCLAINQFVGSPLQPNTITLDKFVEYHHINSLDFIKIDVDGGDYNVLLGAQETIQRFHPVLVVEMASNHQQIYDFLLSSGYKFLIGMENEEVKPPFFPPNIIAWTSKIQIPPRGTI